MDGMSFDDLSRALAQQLPRRRALRLVGAAFAALGSTKLLPVTAEAKETPAFHAASLDTIAAEAKKGRHRKKKKVRKYYARCQSDASALEVDCGGFCYNNYGFNTEIFLACVAQCVSCVPYVQHCGYDEAASCLTAFDIIW